MQILKFLEVWASNYREVNMPEKKWEEELKSF